MTGRNEVAKAVSERAVTTFLRERGRYVAAQRHFCERKGWKWDKYATADQLNYVQNLLDQDEKVAEEYLAVYDLGRDHGADAKWVGGQIAKLIRAHKYEKNYHRQRWERKGAGARPKGIGGKMASATHFPSSWVNKGGYLNEFAETSATLVDRGDFERWRAEGISDEEIEAFIEEGRKYYENEERHGAPIGVSRPEHELTEAEQRDLDRGHHPLSRNRGGGGGHRDWVEFERHIRRFIMESGGANVRPGEQMPKEIVAKAHDMAVAHEAILEPLSEHFPWDYLTHADLLICGYPFTLAADAEGTKTGRLSRGHKRLVDSLQECEGCGLPFIAATAKGNPTTKRKTCERACWNLKRRNLRAKAKANATSD